MASIDISGLDKAAVLAALHNAAGKSVIHNGYKRLVMDRDEADELLAEQHYFTYVNGRALFIDISGDRVEVENYDAHNGPRCAEFALADLVAAKVRRESEGEDVSAIAAMAGLS